MAWPKGMPRYKRIGSPASSAVAQEQAGVSALEAECNAGFVAEPSSSAPVLPQGWARGALLNVRNIGSCYRVTLFPEEYDPRSPERCLEFSNSFDCQQFVSRWYARESSDPRAR